MELYVNNNIHPIIPNNVQVMETEHAFSIHSVSLLYIKTSLSAECFTSALVSGLPLRFFKFRVFLPF